MTNSQKPVAIVSGGARGIGLATAEALIKKGYAVALFSRTASEVEAARQKLESLGGSCLALVGDGKDTTFLKDVVDKTIARFGTVTVLVNNMGRSSRKLFAEITLEEWDDIQATNLRAPMWLTRLCLPELKKHPGRAAIVNIVSVAATMGIATGSMYSSAKHGLLGLSRSIFEELREDGIRVTAICPGFVNTPMVNKRPGLDYSKMIQPDDIAATVCHVLDLPETACPVEILMRPLRTPYVK